MAKVFFRDDDAADAGNQRLIRGTPGGAPVTFLYSVTAGATQDKGWITDVGEPNFVGPTPVTGNIFDWDVEIVVVSGSTSVQISTRLDRVNAAGTVQTSSAFSAEQTATGGQLHRFTDPDLGTWSATDRYRVLIRCRSTAAHGGAIEIQIEGNTPSSEVFAPFTEVVTSLPFKRKDRLYIPAI